MPELPEIELATKRFREAAVGRTIVAVHVMHKALEKSLTNEAKSALYDRKVVTVNRRAKIQLGELDNGAVLEVHFRLTGDWSVGDGGDDYEKHERGRIVFDNGKRISLIDPRAFGVIKLHAPGELKLPRLGIEPLSSDFTSEALRLALAKRSIPIKQALLDQKIIAGLGNIYAAEALWEARMSPELASNSLSKASISKLTNAIVSVLKRAPAARYYYDGNSSSSRDADFAWRVYDREGEPCVQCGSAIERIGQGGRSTYYCPTCQRR